MSNCDTFAAHFNGVCPSLAVLCYPWSMFCLAFGVFFHEYGRRVGGVSRSSLKGKETHLMMGKRTQGNLPKEPKPEPQNNKPTKRGQRPFSHHPKRCFLCTEVRQVKRTGCVLSMGLNSLQKAVKRVSARAKSKAKPVKGASFRQNCDHTATASSGKTWC